MAKGNATAAQQPLHFPWLQHTAWQQWLRSPCRAPAEPPCLDGSAAPLLHHPGSTFLPATAEAAPLQTAGRLTPLTLKIKPSQADPDFDSIQVKPELSEVYQLSNKKKV